MISTKLLATLLAVVSIVLVTVIAASSSATTACSYHVGAYKGLQLNQLSRELETTGLIGNVHGAVSSSQLFVLSVREPDNFFNHREFSLLASDQATRKTLRQMNRHDRICVQGHFISNPSPQKHIAVKSVQILEAWKGLTGFPDYKRAANFPAELKHKTSVVGKVHAIDESGQVLVVEYKDGIIPIFVPATQYTKGLYRGDIIRLAYRIQNKPQQPTHVQLNLDVPQPIEVLDAIAAWHEQPKMLTGKLVKFPQSPQLNFDVYAIEVETQGIKRDFTLVNFTDGNEFKKIREKLAQIWDSHAKTVQSGRNSLINPKVLLTAQGRVNVASPKQANPQILLDTAEDIQLAQS